MRRKILRGFEEQSDHLLLARIPDPEIITSPQKKKKKKKERTYTLVLPIPVDHRLKIAEKAKRETSSRTFYYENDGDTNCNWCA